jgi:hypothetical protein
VLAAVVLGNASHRIGLFVLGMTPHAFNSSPDVGALCQQQATERDLPHL